MKKRVFGLRSLFAVMVTAALCAVLCLSFAACGSSSAYDIAVEHGFEGTEEEWLESLRGENGKDGEDGKDGADGEDGKDGVNGETPTITINEDGYWVINGEVTDVKAEGEKGDKGDPGEKGEQGDKGDPGEKGEQGDKGDPGDKGETGATGATGAQGEDGERGSKWFYGESAPSAGSGYLEGDMYYCIANNTIWYYESGAWKLIASLTGADTGEEDPGTHEYEYVFEAENTDLTGKSYPGLSGMASEIGLIQNYTTNTLGEALNASGGKYVGYMTEEGARVTFNIVSDMEVDDAKLVVRLSKELCDYTLSPDNYSIELNAIPFSGWGPIEFKNVPAQEGASDVSNCYALPFQDYVIAENVHLKEGVNTINLIVMNSDPIAGTTITANGPLIDCIKITTSAVLDWSAAHGLPKVYD